MNRHIYILLFAIAALLGWSCQQEVIDEPVYKDAGMLEVSFAYKDAAAKSIVLSPAFQTIEVEAILNFADMKWNVISNQPWCIVDDDIIHEGSGTFTITVVENEGYDDREPAVVSLCAGEYKANLRVTQVGNVFVLDQVFGLGMKKAGSAEIMVKVEEGVEWTTLQPDWIHVNKEVVSTSAGETEYKMTIQWKDNDGASRLGQVELCKGEDGVPSAKYALWQFGDGEEYDFEADDNIRMASKPSAEKPLEIRTPSNHIESLKYPAWVQLEKVDNGDNTTSWFLYFDPNPSDSNSYRETTIGYTTIGASEATDLSTIYQNYYPIGGLVTAKGFAMFAEKFNKGGADAVKDWVKDGVVTVLSPIDMSQLETSWVSIGTETQPFNLKFNGDNRAFSQFTADAPLFGVCKGAEIYNVVLDKTCAIASDTDFNTDMYFSSIVAKLNNSTLRNCSSAASVALNARSIQSTSVVYAAGLAAYAGPGSVITGSRNEGQLSVAVTRTASGGEVLIGGVAGYVDGTMTECVNAGDVSDNSIAKAHYVGGLAGKTCAELSDLQNTGAVSVNANDESIYLGGVIGHVETGSLIKCYSTSAKVTYDKPAEAENKLANLGKFVYVGGVVGSLNIPLELDCSDMPVVCDVNSAGMKNGGELLVGGIFGVAKKELNLKSPRWSGNINFNMTAETTEKNNVGIGGVVGSAESASTLLTDAETSGTIKVFAQSSIYWKVPTAIGGILGCASDGCTITKSTNKTSLEWESTTKASSAGGVVSSGGIVGRIDKGLAIISECTNSADVHNILRHEARWNSGYLLASRTGGIIGTYGYVKASDKYDTDLSVFEQIESNNITISDCHTTSEVLGHRGLVGGIAGCLYNAVVTNCSFTGICSSTRYNCNVGGIAGAVENTQIKNCVVKASLFSRSYGNCECKAGGIAAYLYTGSSIADCKYFGHITSGDNGNAVAYYGGIVAEADAATNCIVKSCYFGGSILGKDITSENYAEYAVGNNAINAESCSYWDGK